METKGEVTLWATQRKLLNSHNHPKYTPDTWNVGIRSERLSAPFLAGRCRSVSKPFHTFFSHSIFRVHYRCDCTLCTVGVYAVYGPQSPLPHANICCFKVVVVARPLTDTVCVCVSGSLCVRRFPRCAAFSLSPSPPLTHIHALSAP